MILGQTKQDFFVYHEGIAYKDTNEDCTFLLKFINEAVSSKIKHLHVLSDQLQNKIKTAAL